MNDCGRWSFVEWQRWVDDGCRECCRDDLVRCRRALRSATKSERVLLLREIVRCERVLK